MSVRFFIGSAEIVLRFWFFVSAALFAMISNQPIVLFVALPILIHELGHILALLVCGVRIRSVVFGLVSVDIVRHSGMMETAKESLVGMGGVAANLLAASVLYMFSPGETIRPLIYTNIAIAAFNLLPIRGLDGGNLAALFCEKFFFPYAALIISKAISFAALVPLFGVSIWLLWEGYGNFSLLFCCVYLAARILREQ